MSITIYHDHSDDDDGDSYDIIGKCKIFRHDFRHGNGVKFKCVASIYDAYYKVMVSKAMQLMMVMMVVFLRLV